MFTLAQLYCGLQLAVVLQGFRHRPFALIDSPFPMMEISEKLFSHLIIFSAGDLLGRPGNVDHMVEFYLNKIFNVSWP